jgi:YbbR domain-containing protein
MKMIDKKHQEWQQRNADKTRAYTAKYEASRVKVSVTLKKEIAEQIDKIKPRLQKKGTGNREQGTGSK